jgi:hypothetical protein
VCSGTQKGVAIEPGPHLGMFVPAIIVEDNVDDFADRDMAFNRTKKADELLVRWRCMQRPITLPSSTSRAANSVVAPLHL